VLSVAALFAEHLLDQDALGFANRRQPVRSGLLMTARGGDEQVRYGWGPAWSSPGRLRR
jgi:hypothetical protein